MDALGHDWVALVQYELTPDDALKFITPDPDDPGVVTELAGDEAPAPDDPKPFLGTHNLRHKDVGIVCMNCEEAATPELISSPCRNPGDYQTRSPGTNLAPDKRMGSVGRNDPCPCGSGKKFKRCHGA